MPRFMGWSAPSGGWPVFGPDGKRVRAETDEPETETDGYGECDVNTCHRRAVHATIGEAGDLYLCDVHRAPWS